MSEWSKPYTEKRESKDEAKNRCVITESTFCNLVRNGQVVQKQLINEIVTFVGEFSEQEKQKILKAHNIPLPPL
jgi:hypothetical protein